MGHSGIASHRRYSTITGYFLQDDPETVASNFSYAATNFGLKERRYDSDEGFVGPDTTQWQRFEREVAHLNAESARNEQYRVVFLGRHGQGVHNAAEEYYGTPAWDCKWSKLDGNETMNWADAHLTDVGIEQARTANRFWAEKIKHEKIPTPQSYYASPLDRCLATARTTFTGLDLPEDRPFRPSVKEFLREVNGVHTCDRRSSKSYLQSTYPEFAFEVGFTENDELWNPDVRESDSAIDARLKQLINDVFEHDDSTFISFTCHSGVITAILRVVGHRDFHLATGSVIPVLIKEEIVYREEPRTESESWKSLPVCPIEAA